MKSNRRKIMNAYAELTKPRILNLILITTTVGFYLGGRGICSYALLLFTLLGAAMVCAGASALNHYLERDADAKMMRTKNRPLPQGIINPANAMLFGVLLVLGGVFLLWVKVNLLTAFLSLLTAFLYVLVYTPLKRMSWLNTTVGAIPGAIPPMGGWAAATGNVDAGAWVLFLIMFLWQHPHFYSIAWMFREDYKLGGFKMLPVIEPDGEKTFRQIVMFSLLLVPASALPTVVGLSGIMYFYWAIMLSLAFLAAGIALAVARSNAQAHKLLKASVIYLPLLLALIIFDLKL